MSGSEPSSGAPPKFRDQHGRRVLSLNGELDLHVRDVVVRALREHIEAVRSSVIIVDLSAVTFIDSAGLDPLLHAHRELTELDRVLALASISEPVDRLFHVLAGVRPYGLIQQTLRTRSRCVDVGPAADDPDDRQAPRNSSHARQLRTELRAQTLLNEATGLVMAVHDCNAAQAGLLLELVCQRRNLTIADLAEGIVAAADATEGKAPGVGVVAMVPPGVRAALSTRVSSPRAVPGSSP